MRNVTGRFLKPYADLLKHLASLISFTTDKTLTVPFSWFRHRRRTLRCGVEDEGTWYRSLNGWQVFFNGKQIAR